VHYERALALATDPLRRLTLASHLGDCYVQIGDPRGLPWLAEALAGLDPETAPRACARALRSQARYHHLQGRHRQAIGLLEEALALAQRDGDTTDLAGIYAWLAGAYQHLAEFRESDVWAQRIIQLAEERGTPAATSLGWLGWEFLSENAVGAGRYADAIAWATKNREGGEKIHSLARLAWAEYVLTWAYHATGELDAAAAAFHRCEAHAEQIGDLRAAKLATAIAVMNATDLGDPGAGELAAATIASADATGLLGLRLEARRGGSYHALWTGDPERAVVLAEEFRTLVLQSDACMYRLHVGATHGEALLRLGRPDEALAILEETLAIAERAEALGPRFSCLRVRALVRAARGDLDGARDDLARAIAGLEELGAKLELARALQARAGLTGP
jgi:tetratricopeptide (TPR) repeat protein